MFNFIHWFFLSLAVRLPRLLSRRWATKFLVSRQLAAPREDWQECVNSHVQWQPKTRNYEVCMHFWSGNFVGTAGLNETNPLLVYVWRCTTPRELQGKAFDYAVSDAYLAAFPIDQN